MRITMSMMSSQYNKSLNNSLSQLNTSMNRSTTYRKFDTASEDPFSAIKAFRLRREFQENDNYQSNLKELDSQLLTAQSCMITINSKVQEAASGDCIQAINGTVSEDDREIIATKLRQLQQTILSEANTKFSDKYIFGGSATETAPFTVNDDGDLLFRGINVSTGEIEAGTMASIGDSEITFGKGTGTQFNGYTVKIGSGTAGTVSVDNTVTNKVITVNLASDATYQDLQDTLQGATGFTDVSGDALDFSNIGLSGDLSKTVINGDSSTIATNTIGQNGLKSLAQENTFVDLGLGLKFNIDGSINKQSVYDSSIPGISFLGYGCVEGSDVSNNIYTLVGQIADKLDGKDGSEYSLSSIEAYLDNFESASQNLLVEITESGTKSNFLTTVQTGLETMSDSINEKLVDTEYLDTTDAILDYTMQNYAYTAALQMGTRLLQPTIFDYLS